MGKDACRCLQLGGDAGRVVPAWSRGCIADTVSDRAAGSSRPGRSAVRPLTEASTGPANSRMAAEPRRLEGADGRADSGEVSRGLAAIVPARVGSWHHHRRAAASAGHARRSPRGGNAFSTGELRCASDTRVPFDTVVECRGTSANAYAPPGRSPPAPCRARCRGTRAASDARPGSNTCRARDTDGSSSAPSGADTPHGGVDVRRPTRSSQHARVLLARHDKRTDPSRHQALRTLLRSRSAASDLASSDDGPLRDQRSTGVCQVQYGSPASLGRCGLASRPRHVWAMYDCAIRYQRRR